MRFHTVESVLRQKKKEEKKEKKRPRMFRQFFGVSCRNGAVIDCECFFLPA